MNAYNMMIQVCNSTPNIWRKIEVTDSLSFQQLHEAILVLFHWKKERDAYFQIAEHTLYMDKKMYHCSSELPLSTYLSEETTFTYVYGTKEELWEITLTASKIDCEDASLKLLDYEQGFPLYGMGGIHLYQNIQKEVTCTSKESSLQLLLNRLSYPFDEYEIAIYFANIIKRNHELTRGIHRVLFNQELLSCRALLENSTAIAPHLVIVKKQEGSYPCYIDFLDDGMEIMVFKDQSSFARSIVNSINDDPDLLFTNALTINFLYEDSDASDLYLYGKRILCYVNRPGCLPTCPKDEDFVFLTEILKQLNSALLTHKLPSLSNHRILVTEDEHTIECPYEINEEVCSVQVSSIEKKTLRRLPHTNECIALNFTAVPGSNCEKNKLMDIHLVARGNRYVKDELVNVESLPMLIEQLYSYLDELVHERCIPESISTNNINLAHMIQQFCDEFQIDLQLFTPSSQYKEDLLEVLASTLNVTAQELLLMDEKQEDAKQLMYSDVKLSKAPSVQKYYN